MVFLKCIQIHSIIVIERRLITDYFKTCNKLDSITNAFFFQLPQPILINLNNEINCQTNC